jgi:hypothetical protein
MEMIYYVDSKEMVDKPKPGRQFIAWYYRGSINNPSGIPHVDVINGQEVQLRSLDEEALQTFLSTAYSRAPYIKVTTIFENMGSDE